MKKQVKRVKRFTFPESAMKPIELVREALKVITGYPVTFAHTDVTIWGEKDDWYTVADVEGFIRSFQDLKFAKIPHPPLLYAKVRATLMAGDDMPLQCARIELAEKTFLLRRNPDWIPDPNTSPFEIVSGKHQQVG